MAKASLQLALIANNTKSIVLSRRKAKVDLNANSVHDERDPASCPKCDVKSTAFPRYVASKQLCTDGDPTVCGAVGGETLWIIRLESFLSFIGVDEGDFIALHGMIIATSLSNNDNADDHDDA